MGTYDSVKMVGTASTFSAESRSQFVLKNAVEPAQSGDAKQRAETIIQQMGGSGKLRAMVGATQFAFDDSGVRFSFKGCRKANKCVVELTAMDTYNLKFYRYSPTKGTCDEKQAYEGVYCDQLIELFEGYTGLYLTF